MVSKVFTNEDSVKVENKFAKLVAEWDPHGKYFIVPHTLCKVDMNMVRKHKEVDGCYPLDQIREKYVSQIIMPNGGKDLHALSKEVPNFRFSLKEWIGLLDNVFKGMVIINKKGYVHMDIKSDNLIYNGKKIRMFDFSLSVKAEHIYTTNIGRLNYPYFPYPFEFLLVYYTLRPKDEISVLSAYLENLMAFGQKEYANYLKYHTVDKIRTVRENIRTWTTTDKKWIATIKSQTDKIDIYAIGMVCISMHNTLDFSSAPEALQNAYRDFVISLTEMDIRERLSLDQAHTTLKQLLLVEKSTVPR